MDYKLPIFKSGNWALYNSRYYRIKHVVISGYELFVVLDGIDDRIEASKVDTDGIMIKEQT